MIPNAPEARRDMVARQIASRGVNDPRVLSAMARVPRERFVPQALRGLAFADAPLPIGEGQTISQPYIVAHTLAAMKLAPGDEVLEVGTGSGYVAAVLAEMELEVVSIERHATLAERARRVLSELGYAVTVVVGDGSVGYPARAPYDGIVVSAGAPQPPRPLLSQLAVGASLVVPDSPVNSFPARARPVVSEPVPSRSDPIRCNTRARRQVDEGVELEAAG